MIHTTALLTKGLGEGYAGKTIIETVDRGGFVLKKSHYAGAEGKYHDEWYAKRTGGGQEIGEAGEETYTRLYAGGTLKEELLIPLGISEKDVLGYLMKKVTELGESTRLFADCTPDPDGDWQYQYNVTDRIDTVGLTRALESIMYKGIQVFVHGFEICKVS